jgi:hypothetical protein
MKRRKSHVLAGLVAAILLSTGISFAALPRAYLGLATVGADAGYHGWFDQVQGRQTAWWGVNGAVVEGRLILNSGFGFGFRVVDTAVGLLVNDSSKLRPFATTYTEFAPSILWVLHDNDRGFGFLELQVMPYVYGASGAALDYAYVPFAPWPLEAHVRLGATVYSWTYYWPPVEQMGYQLSAGVRLGLGWWFMQRVHPFRI